MKIQKKNTVIRKSVRVCSQPQRYPLPEQKNHQTNPKIPRPRKIRVFLQKKPRPSGKKKQTMNKNSSNKEQNSSYIEMNKSKEQNSNNNSSNVRNLKQELKLCNDTVFFLIKHIGTLEASLVP